MISNFTQNRSQEPFTAKEIDLLNKRIVNVLMEANKGVRVHSGDVTAALGALWWIVEQAKRGRNG